MDSETLRGIISLFIIGGFAILSEFFRFKFFSRLKKVYPEERETLDLSDKPNLHRLVYNSKIKREYFKSNAYKKFNDQELNSFVNLEAIFISLFFICSALFIGYLLVF